MGLLDRAKRVNKDLVRTQRDLKVSQSNLSRAEDDLKQAIEVDKKLKDRFVGKLFRGKLIENIHIAVLEDGSKLIKIQGRVLSFNEYLTNDYKELVKDDAWLSGPFGVYGGVADRKWWNSFMNSVSGYSGIAIDDRNVSANRLLSTGKTYKIVKSYSFTIDEQQILKKILTDELSMDEMFFFPEIKGFVDDDVLKEAYDKIIEFIVKESDILKVDNKRWYLFNEEGSQEAFVDKVVKFADTVVDEIVRVKDLDK